MHHSYLKANRNFNHRTSAFNFPTSTTHSSKNASPAKAKNLPSSKEKDTFNLSAWEVTCRLAVSPCQQVESRRHMWSRTPPTSLVRITGRLLDVWTVMLWESIVSVVPLVHMMTEVNVSPSLWYFFQVTANWWRFGFRRWRAIQKVRQRAILRHRPSQTPRIQSIRRTSW